jgi:hypothetical protein
VNPDRRFLAWLVALVAPAVALVFAVSIASGTWERVKTKPEKRTLKVTGSATKRIVSDLIEWQSRIETFDADRTAAYRALKEHVARARTFLREQGIPEDAIRVSSVSTHEVVDTEFVGTGSERIQRRIMRGWTTSQSISVRSTDVPLVERVSREITDLLERGVPITSSAPTYHYTKLSEIKVDMLAAASADAKERAQKIVQAAGGADLGKLWNADMGVININSANSTATSWEGNNDKSSLEKDIITIVHLTFELP